MDRQTANRRTDGWTDVPVVERTDERTDVRTDGLTYGRPDGQTDRHDINKPIKGDQKNDYFDRDIPTIRRITRKTRRRSGRLSTDTRRRIDRY